MKIGVTGGNGFIGTHVIDRLEQVGHEVLILDHRARPAGQRPVMLGDVRDETAVREFAAHVDGIIHLAAVLGTQETIQAPRPAAETNILGTINVLEAARTYRLPVVNIAVGNFWHRNTYSTTKRAAERLVDQYRDELAVAAANVRCVNAYGPGQSVAAPYGPAKVRKIIPSFVVRALSGAPIEVYGDGSQVSDMVWVGDVARTLVATLERCADGQVPTHPIEVGSTAPTTVLEVARLVQSEVARQTGSTSPVTHLPMRPGETSGALLPGTWAWSAADALASYAGDNVAEHTTPAQRHAVRALARQVTNHVVADLSTLAAVGINPATLKPLQAGIAETVRWFAAVEGSAWRAPVGASL